MGLFRIKKYLEQHNVLIEAKGIHESLNEKYNVIFKIFNKEDNK
jgi:hypothetical protein